VPRTVGCNVLKLDRTVFLQKSNPVLIGGTKPILCKIKKQFEQNNTYNIHLLNENMLVQTGFKDKDKFTNSLENFFVPCCIITKCKLQKNLTKMNFSEGCLKMMNTPNAGGSSLISEVLSFEFLKLFSNATLCKTEMEITYFPRGSKITDYSVQIGDEIFGVSVTRAFHYQGSKFYTEKAATHLLQKKLNGIFWSSKNVISSDKWKKQILHTFVPDQTSAKIVQNAYRKLKSSERGNSILLITICNSSLIFQEKQGYSFNSNFSTTVLSN